MSRTTGRGAPALLLTLIFLCGLALTAPVAPVAARAAAPAAVPTPVTSGVPRFEPGACAFELPDDQREGQTVLCGWAVVPERHADPGGKTIRLPVAVFKSRNPAPAPEPIVLLQGGPGADSQVFADSLGAASPFYQGLGANNDIVIFDQRGTGKAEPSLGCPEVTLATLESQAFVQALADSPLVTAMARCRDRLVAHGVDLAAYTTTENAADVNAVRAVLGYPRMNLYGGSYGSELGLAVMRDYPQYVRAAALESIVPLQKFVFFDVPRTFDRALNELFAACAADPACARAYPDLKGSFQRGVARLNATPAVVTLRDPASGQSAPLPITGVLWSQVLFQFFYAGPLLPYLPDMIARVERGDTRFLEVLLPLLLARGAGLSYGMHFSVACSKDVTAAARDQALAADERILPEARAALEPLFVQDYYTICQGWPSLRGDPQAGRPVVSDVPVLLTSGRFDPVTPPSYAELVAQTLSNDASVVLADQGHSPTFASQCGFIIVLRFLADPTRAPDALCAAQARVTFAPLPAQLGGAPAPQPTPAQPAPTPARPATPTPTPTPAPMPGLPNTGQGPSGTFVATPGAAGGGAMPLALALLGLGAAGAIARAYRRRRAR